MELSNRRAQQYEAGVVSVVEAAVLAGSVGETFDAVVVDLHEHGGGATVQLHEPAVLARAHGDGLDRRAQARSTRRARQRFS